MNVRTLDALEVQTYAGFDKTNMKARILQSGLQKSTKKGREIHAAMSAAT